MKQFKKVLLVLVGTGSIYIGSLLVMIFSSTHDVPDDSPNTIIILGAHVLGTSPAKAHPSTVLKERLDTAIPYIKKNPHVSVIVCGGQGADEIVSEAQVMKDYLITKGISADRIIKETQSTRTKENIDNAQQLIPSKKAVIVTSDFHMYRAKLLAR
jgi:uncharacterized SAM-binding protein YcdF (DUF218 family)